MTHRSLSLIPAFSGNLFSDRFAQMDNLFSRLTGEKPLSDSTAYNLLQKDREHYELTVSVPGWQQNELDISVLNNQLIISGKLDSEKTKPVSEKDETKWLHQGIRKNPFSLSFNLEHRINIKQASLHDGLLTLQFSYDIPEKEKPQKIAISARKVPDIAIEHKTD
jgi:molecular chaperone IbpA